MTKLRNVILKSTSQNPASISQAHGPSQKQNHGKAWSNKEAQMNKTKLRYKTLGIM